jgi:carbamoyltransferase
MQILNLSEIEDFFVCPAAGDTSLPLGACYYVMCKFLKENGGSMDMLQPLKHAYLGPEFSTGDVETAIKAGNIGDKYSAVSGVTPDVVANELASGKIIARCSGRMEFGLRALGNRSIMADPRHYNTIRKINDAIKFRDFWMPFTPSILEEREKDYIVNPKGVKSSFMTLAFDSTELARRDLVAALHPADLTVRPQVVSKQVNQEYYQIIKEFENITGVGGILNTSLNLHGEPIVLGPKEALYTLKNSELDGLLMNDILIQRC